jgi:Derlin-2/3
MVAVNLADTGTVYTHGSKLETASPRFSQPGDFLTYVLFVCATILVGIAFLFSFSFLSCFSFHTPTSYYLPA